MTISKLKVGQIVYSVSTSKMGNTTVSTTNVHAVRIVEINPGADGASPYVVASWNGNAPRKFYKTAFSKWRASKPLLITGGFGRQRLATRQEIADAKKAGEVQ